jgi:ring-1,2-phenylacetyl-CoA epoxidase subunit PaaC
LFDEAELLRFEMLAHSKFEPVAQLARKYRGEIKYHVMHAEVWIKQLGKANEESHGRMQAALNASWNMALGIFEEGPFEEILKAEGIFEGERALYDKWLEKVSAIIGQASLVIPPHNEWAPVYGGRTGMHTAHLQPLLDEMTEVYKIDPKAEW